MISQDETMWLYFARMFVGHGTAEERFIRLMGWVGAVTIPFGPHTKIYDPVAILNDRRAWCDQQVLLFLWCAWKLFGIKGRQVAVYHTDGKNGHTVAELLVGGRWVLFDVASEHQAVYRDRNGNLMGRSELVADPSPIISEAHPWKGNNGVGKVGFYDPSSRHAEVAWRWK